MAGAGLNRRPPFRFGGTMKGLRPAVLALAIGGTAIVHAPPAALGQQADVTFFGAGRVARFEQDEAGELALLNYVFFAEVFLTRDGRASDATLTFPGAEGAAKALEYRHSDSPLINDVMYLNGAAASKDELDRAYPVGAYLFDFATPSGEVKNAAVSFEGSAFPKQPVIELRQDGRPVAVGEIDAAKDLVVTWPPFAGGKADPNGILDDLIFVAVNSCTVEDMVHSGRPFEGTDYLTYRAREYVIGAASLEPGQTYNMYVEHAALASTYNLSGVPAFATYASSTYLEFRTAGTAAADSCPGSR